MAVTRLEITSEQPLAGGQEFGDAGAYRQIDGIAHISRWTRTKGPMS